jgi:transcriptional regulator with GAF, ATPase, and Fis domain
MRLVAQNGPLAGTSLALSDGLTIPIPGTDPGSVQPGCTVSAATDGFALHALDNGTPIFVNGLPATTRRLELHDELRIGDSLFIVHDDEPAVPSTLSACGVTVESSVRARHVLEVSADEALLHGGTASGTREERDLGTLIRVAAALTSVQDLAVLDGALAGLLLDLVPVSRLVFTDRGQGAAAVRSAWSAGVCEDPIKVDRELLERVSRDGLAVLIELDGREAIVAPMMAFGRATGCVWAETAPGERLDAGHVRLLLVVLALATVAREQSREAARLQEANELLKAEINLDHNMVGRSKPMRALFDRIARVARTDTTILLRGESGTGKELVARAAHRNSPRTDRPFIAVNCAALTESLLESELFGHEKGAFTGAIGLKKGKLELADGGTLFLDEIGELPLSLQAKLLRALQEREFDRVGGTRPVRVDFRLIAATNRDLEASIQTGQFRQDLYYRVNVVTLALPPLRDRADDISVLADYFVRKHASRCGRRVRGIAPDAVTRLLRHDWPGNVRELENVIEQALALGTDEWIVAEDLPATFGPRTAAPAGPAAGSGSLHYHDRMEQTKRELIVGAFERAGHSHADAARLLGVHPNYLHRLLRNLDLRARVGPGRATGNGDRTE